MSLHAWDTFVQDLATAGNLDERVHCEGRELTLDEQQKLEAHGNRAVDWSCVRITGDDIDDNSIHGCTFIGPVLLGRFGSQLPLATCPDLSAPSGLYNSVLGWCIIEAEALVSGCQGLSRCVVGTGAAIIGCGVVSGTTMTHYANGMGIDVGPETGGRTVPCWAGMSLSEATTWAVSGSNKDISGPGACLSQEVKFESRLWSFVGSSARVISCPRVTDVYIGPCALLSNVEVRCATVLSSLDEPTRLEGGSILSDVLVQCGVVVEEGSLVKNSLLMEHCHVQSHAKVTHSIIGPDSGVGTGECHHSLVGPFVGFHHQSLLIAAVWPQGRGNLAYGSNVGSNHTGRQADQEIWPGEGCFFGLATIVKYPTNLLESPYSIIAAGASCLPQRVCFPFSLIMPPDTHVDQFPAGFNRLVPGWVLSKSMYTVVRNEHKYRTRAKARRTRTNYEIFRPAIIRLLMEARARLMACAAKEGYLTEKELAGCGKNFVSAEDRASAIQTYTIHIQRYALRRLLAAREGQKASADKGSAPEQLLCSPNPSTQPPPAPPHTHRSPSLGLPTLAQRRPLAVDAEELAATFRLPAPSMEEEDGGLYLQILREDFLAPAGGVAELNADRADELLTVNLARIEALVADAVLSSKARDDTRGAAIIPGYAVAHPAAQDDKIVQLAQTDRDKVLHRILEVVGKPSA